ncbi:ankyrin repeat domain-containing protein SOWAHA-like [Leucoraja erinacea]|uniref:ankyrin repeat domain-containing protein SOWAHA-like n=1 Tax=Leucoraja erinaceus TaxID=7782 RepID=UPI0024566ED8|nr:ankyrin repeat domain-containing protein SOWAHA-like [Leucoraja erinacea]
MEPTLCQEVVTKFLVGSAGKVENSKLLFHFRNQLCQSDPQLKKEARELFKSFINKVAVVREEDGVKYVVLKKRMHHLLPGEEMPKALGKGESLGDLVEGLLEPEVRRNSAPSALSPGQGTSLNAGLWGGNSARPLPDPPSADGEVGLPGQHPATSSENLPTSGDRDPASASASEKVAEDLKTDLVPPQPEQLGTPPPPPEKANPSLPDPKTESKANVDPGLRGPKTTSVQKTKPYMYPLRLPPDSHKVSGPYSEQKKESPDTQSKNTSVVASGNQAGAKTKRSQPAESGSSSPYLKRASRVLKLPEDARFSDQVPLDPMEHEWIVKTALGHWTHVTGLLLKDHYLAEKKDFMSGFTAVHWAAKFGNSDMMCWIIDSTERNGVKVDINCKSHGGYTPLHIAAIHSRDNVIIELVGKYGAKTTLRDYSGKRPHHYLAKESSLVVRQMLGDPEASASESVHQKRGSKVASSILSGGNSLLGALVEDALFPDLSKSLKKPANLSKFFTAPTVHIHKKRAKTRTNFASLHEEPEEEREEVVVKRRPVTEVFF